MGKKSKGHAPVKPKRNSEWLVASWIGAISALIAANILIDGQFRWENGTGGTLITASRNPIMFSAGALFPLAICTFMVTRVVRAERYYRVSIKLYDEQVNDDRS